MAVRVRLFGNPAVFDDGRWFELGTTVDDAVLCYLALEQGWVARTVVAGHFWPDSDESTARANLRWRLHRVRSRSYAVGLEATRDHLRWQVESDVEEFRTAVEAGELATALELARAPLLGEARFANAPGLDGVFAREREWLQRLWRDAAMSHAEAARARREHGEAAAMLARVLQHDLLDEELVQAYLHSAFVDGQREQALRTYAAFEHQLSEELGIEPLAQTRALVATIRQADDLLGRAVLGDQDGSSVTVVETTLASANAPVTETDSSARESVESAVTPPPERRSDALPRFLTPFLGRRDEHELLVDLLSKDDERLVTLLGPGGVGKTRLAVEVALELAPRQRDGTVFVDASELDDDSRLPAAIVEAVAPTQRVAQDASAQLVELLREREMLLVLDTFEDAMSAVPLVERIVASAPGVRVLVTSRVRLSLAGERSFELTGLTCPPEDATFDEAGSYPSVRLFENVASRAFSAFTTGPAERAAVARVCRLVGGLPLAIELAATWVRALSPQEIAEELSSSAELLTNAEAGTPARRRHASFEQVFDTSWSMLRPADQAVFAALAVFRGGFTRETAAEVAGAGLRHLRTLIDASLVQRFGKRYVLLDVIQRLAERRLEASGRSLRVRQRHARLFARWLAEHEAALEGPEQARAITALNPESENVRAAWRFAVASRDFDALMSLSRGVANLWDLRGRFAEAVAMFADAAEAIEHVAHGGDVPGIEHEERGGGAAQGSERTEKSARAELAYAWMRLREGHFRFYLGQYGSIPAHLARARETFSEHGEAAAAGTSALVLANVCNAQGELDSARRHLEDALSDFVHAGDAAGEAKCANTLGMVEEAAGQHTRAREHYLRSLVERERLGDPRGLIVVLNNLAGVCLELGLRAEAAEHIQRAERLSSSTDDAWGIAWTAHGLGELALAQGRRDTARAAFERALKGLVGLGHDYATTLTRERLAELLLPSAPEEAALHLRDALRTALAARATPRVAQLVAWLAWLKAERDPEEGVALLHCARAATPHLQRPRVLTELLLNDLQGDLDSAAKERAERRGATLDLREEAEVLCRWVDTAELPRATRAAPPLTR